MGDYKKSGGFGAKKSGGFRDGNNYGRRPGFGSQPSFGRGRPSFGRSDRGDSLREMFQAVCADCGKSCQVPFRPTGDKPVYCSDCFGSHRAGENRDNRGRRDESRDKQYASKREFSSFFQSRSVTSDKRIDELKRQLDVVAEKVDTIFRIVGGKDSGSSAFEKKPKKEIDTKAVASSLKEMMLSAGRGKGKTNRKITSKKGEKKSPKKLVKKTVRKKR